MARSKKGLQLTPEEAANAFSGELWAQKFPPVLTIDQAAELLQIPKQTIYAWSSRGLLNDCCRKVGKHLRFLRDRLLIHVFNRGL